MRPPAIPAVLLLLGLALSGCSGDGGEPTETLTAPSVEATPDTGGIRGVVVTPGIVPVETARVAIANGPETTTDKAGAFAFGRLRPGEYFLAVSKPGYSTVQATATVRAGDAEPPVLKVIIEQLSGQMPYVEHHRLDGFYECGFALPVITDQCDFGLRTAYDAANETAGPPPVPRNAQRNVNTQFIQVPATVRAVVQEAFWTDPQVKAMLVELAATPIDNSCDCSDTYLEVVSPSPTHSRLDDAKQVAGKLVAARGFLPFTEAADPAAAAVNFQFTIVTTLFHHHVPAKGWTFETRDQHPL